MKKFKLKAPVVFVSMMFIVAGVAVNIYQRNEDEKCPESINAVVVGYNQESVQSEDDEGNTQTKTVYQPVLSYTYQGKEYRESKSKYIDMKAYDLQQIIEININPEDPTEYNIPSESAVTMQTSNVFIIMGAVVFILGLIF